MRKLLASLLLLPAVAIAEPVRLERLDGARHQLTLPTELGSSWQTVNVGRLRVRAPRQQRSLDGEGLPASPHLPLKLGARACSLLEIDLGPAAARGRGDSWQRVTSCTKIAHCPAGAGAAVRGRATSLLTAKTGSRAEVRPLTNPLTLVPGTTLPVRLYYEGEGAGSATVLAAGPDGARVSATADRHGIAFLTLPTHGRWTLRFERAGVTGELIFDVPPTS